MNKNSNATAQTSKTISNLNKYLTWTDVSNYYDASSPSTSVTFSGNLYTVRSLSDNKIWVASSGYLAYSSDGEHWYLMSGSQRGDNYSSSIYGIAYEPSKGYVLGTCYAAGISYSSSGSPGTWSKKSTPYSTYIWDTIYANGKFFTGHESGYISYSTNGTSWYSAVYSSGSTIIGSSSNNILSITYGNKFVAVAWNGYTSYSSNGQTWYLGTKSSTNLFNVVYANGKYISSSQSNFIGISTNGQTWDYSKTISGLSTSKYHFICYGAGVWLLVEGDNNKVWASIDDGANWTQLSNTFGTNIYSSVGTRICYSEKLNRFFVGCQSGKIYSAPWSSTCGTITWNGSLNEVVVEADTSEISVTANNPITFNCEGIDLISATLVHKTQGICGARITSKKAGKIKLKVTN